MAVWDLFDEDARRAVYHAQCEAQRLGMKDVSTEHLLLGLLIEGETAAARMLWNLRLDPVDVRRAVERACRKGNRTAFEGMALTPAGMRAIDWAIHESAALCDEHIGTEHLLLGLFGEGSSVAWKTLRKLGMSFPKMRDAVESVRRAP